MKKKTYINYNFESCVNPFFCKYLNNFGENATLINGKSKAKTYSAPFTDYQVKIWQTKTLINVEVIR